MFEEYHYLFKIVVIGDSGVGKTNLVSKFVDNTFLLDEKPTIGVQFSSKSIKIDQHDIRCQLWDTAGQQRFRAITKAYYNGAVGALVVFDLTSSQTFENVAKWIEEAEQNTKQNTLVLLVGNKSDLPSRSVSMAAVQKFLDSRTSPMLYMQTSALTGQNVNEAFTKLVETIYNQRKTELELNKRKSSVKETPVNSDVFENPLPAKKPEVVQAPIVLKSENFKDREISAIKPPGSKKKKKCC